MNANTNKQLTKVEKALVELLRTVAAPDHNQEEQDRIYNYLVSAKIISPEENLLTQEFKIAYPRVAEIAENDLF